MLEAMAALHSRELSADVLALYWAALQAYDLAAIRQALDRHTKNPDSGQFMPKPADVIRMLGGTTEDAAAQAWAKVERAIRRVGGYPDVAFDDAAIHRCIDDMGGWTKLCNGLEADLPFRQRDFTTLYRGYAMRRDVPAYPALLRGRFSVDAEGRGYSNRLPVPQPPVLIGDAERAAQVVKGGQAAPLIAMTQLRLGGNDGFRGSQA